MNKVQLNLDASLWSIIMFLHASMFTLLTINFYVKKTEGYALISALNFTEFFF